MSDVPRRALALVARAASATRSAIALHRVADACQPLVAKPPRKVAPPAGRPSGMAPRQLANRVNPLNVLFPGICLLCRAHSERDMDLCVECEQAFAVNARSCSVCAEPVPLRPGGLPDDREICGACLVCAPPWTRTVAPFLFLPPLTTVVEGLKSGNGLLQARILGRLLAAAVRDRYRGESLPNAVVPMPLARRRLRQRGFNQADLLAAVTVRALGLRRPKRLLVRTRNVAPQRTLPRAERLRNVRGAFAVRRPLAGGRVALVDDVATTGATVRAATHALLAGGAAEVHVWVAAKTPAERVG